jgi:hypothetical protein
VWVYKERPIKGEKSSKIVACGRAHFDLQRDEFISWHRSRLYVSVLKGLLGFLAGGDDG